MSEDNSKENIPSIPNVETLTEDMVKVLEGDKSGLIKKIIKEQEAHEAERRNTSPESRRNRLFVLAGSLMLLVTVFLLAYVIISNPTQAPIAPPKAVAPSFIFLDESGSLPIDGFDKSRIVTSALYAIDQADLAPGEVFGLTFLENGSPLGLSRFMTLIKGNFVAEYPEFVNQTFMFGAVLNETRDPFLLIKVRSFGDIFSSMRAWENRIFSDLYEFLRVDLNLYTTSVSSREFEDGFFENKNARILYDDLGNIALMYVYADEQSLVISKSPGALHEVLLRLSAGQIKK